MLAERFNQRPVAQSGSLQVYLQLAEQSLYIQGFDQAELKERPPALLRGSLVFKVLKSTKIKSIGLTFKGLARTEWPEGIPPKKSDYLEENVVMYHHWPFYTQDMHDSGADIIDDDDHDNHDAHSTETKENENPLSVLRRVASPSPTRNRARSASKASTIGEFTFQPSTYIYNFEHPIPATAPESIDATFGNVNYNLEVLVERSGAFKSNISSSIPVKIIRTPSEESVEDTEPIAITRDWEDQLHYDIIIAAKSIVLNSYLPIAFKLVPLDKVKLHRIRIYLTENLEYYAKNKKVHRMEPTKKHLLLEHKAPPLTDLPPDADPKLKKMGNLLTSDGKDITAKEFEFQVYVPRKLNRSAELHPDTTYVNIKANHWIKICLRLSRFLNGKPKHYEISIDSPVHVLDEHCAHNNTLLPAYGMHYNLYTPEMTFDERSRSPAERSLNNFESIDASLYKPDFPIDSSPQSSPMISPLSHTLSPSFSRGASPTERAISPLGLRDISPRPIHLLRRPSFEPPPFDADLSPPPIDSREMPADPPQYDEIDQRASGKEQPEEEEEETRGRHVPNISFTRASISPEPKSRATLSTTDDSDLASNFQFRNGLPRARSPARSIRSLGSTGSVDNEPNIYDVLFGHSSTSHISAAPIVIESSESLGSRPFSDLSDLTLNNSSSISNSGTNSSQNLTNDTSVEPEDEISEYHPEGSQETSTFPRASMESTASSFMPLLAPKANPSELEPLLANSMQSVQSFDMEQYPTSFGSKESLIRPEQFNPFGDDITDMRVDGFRNDLFNLNPNVIKRTESRSTLTDKNFVTLGDHEGKQSIEMEQT